MGLTEPEIGCSKVLRWQVRYCARLHPPEVPLYLIRLRHSRRFRRPYFVSIAVFGLVGALGEKDNVSHAFQPEGGHGHQIPRTPLDLCRLVTILPGL